MAGGKRATAMQRNEKEGQKRMMRTNSLSSLVFLTFCLLFYFIHATTNGRTREMWKMSRAKRRRKVVAKRRT